MGFKDLFIASDDNAPKQEQPKPTGASFPTTPVQTTFPAAQTFPVAQPFSPANDEHLDKFAQMYQSTLDKLNQSGYDFYEFYRGILGGNMIDNPQGYQMALAMATGMDNSLTKEKLVSQADYYIAELNKTFQTYADNGNGKKQSLISEKNSENQTLTSDLANLKAQVEALTIQINSKQGLLSSIESKYQPLINEVDSKLRANESAKNDIVNKISKVKTNLSQI
jgi:hypothetical protein